MQSVVDQAQAIEYTLREIADQGLESFVQFEKPEIPGAADLELMLAHVATRMDAKLPFDECRKMFSLAIQKATAKHPDFPIYIEAMLVASLGVLPYIWRLSWDELVEAVYCIGRHADFLESARSRALLARTPAGEYVQ